MSRFLKSVLAAAIAVTVVSCCGQKQQEGNDMIRLNVTVTVAPEFHAEVVEGLNLLAAESRKENGCIGYEIYQNTVQADQLVIVETWANQEVLDAHGQTAHYTTILPPLKDKMKLELERFDY